MDLLQTYSRHPFRVLGATPRHTREELVELQSIAALFGDDESAAQALATLLNPQDRLWAEMSWFPRTDAREVEGLLRAVMQGGSTLSTSFATDSFLAQFNEARLVLATIPLADVSTFKVALYALAELADTLLPGQVIDEINDDRVASGFPLLEDTDEMIMLIEGLLHETVGALRDLRPPKLRGMQAHEFSTALEKSVWQLGTSAYGSIFLKFAAEEIAIW